MKDQENSKKNIAGIILTVIISIGFLWALYQLSGSSGETKPPAPEYARMNEISAYENLKTIAAAQGKYIRRDWDNDGKKTYAMFYVHLWRSVSLDGKPIDVELIPRVLAFAMEATNPLKGYFYLDLRKRLGEGRKGQAFDYAKQWAIAAIPEDRRRTGVLTFIIDQTGAIHATTKFHDRPEYPYAPERNGWTRLHGIEGLKKFQETVSYPD